MPAQINVMKKTINWKENYHIIPSIIILINAFSLTLVHSSVNLVADIARCGTSLESAMVSTFHKLELKNKQLFAYFIAFAEWSKYPPALTQHTGEKGLPCLLAKYTLTVLVQNRCIFFGHGVLLSWPDLVITSWTYLRLKMIQLYKTKVNKEAAFCPESNRHTSAAWRNTICIRNKIWNYFVVGLPG